MERMTKFVKIIFMNRNFELLVRALIIRDNKILLCQTEGRDYYFLPGGHIEFGENMHDALVREIYEEMNVSASNINFIGGIENIFNQEGKMVHEISFIYSVSIDRDDVDAKESHINFTWFSLDQILEINLVPPALKDAIFKWVATKETFFIEERSEN